MNWYQDVVDEEEEDLMFSPALLARRASESWIIAPPVEVCISLINICVLRVYICNECLDTYTIHSNTCSHSRCARRNDIIFWLNSIW